MELVYQFSFILSHMLNQQFNFSFSVFNLFQCLIDIIVLVCKKFQCYFFSHSCFSWHFFANFFQIRFNLILTKNMRIPHKLSFEYFFFFSFIIKVSLLSALKNWIFANLKHITNPFLFQIGSTLCID